MMEKILLCLLFLAGWKSCTCLRLYHTVAEPMTWTEAQTYCRQTYTDLATTENSEEIDKLVSTVSSHLNSYVWIGLYVEVDWKWSDGYTGGGADYRSWETSKEPDLLTGNQFCVLVGYDGAWWDENCKAVYPFICYQGTVENPDYEFINQDVDWYSAQQYCKENFVDLVTIRNSTQNQEAQSLIPADVWAWSGLYRDPYGNWSDGSISTFTHWEGSSSPLRTPGVVCGAANVDNSGKWMLESCETPYPFVCYSLSTSQHVIQLRVKPEDPSVDLNNPVMKMEILKKAKFQNIF